MTNELLQLKKWLKTKGVSHVAIESTGVYWKPVFNVLEESFEVLLANARHVKNVPGRKTDVQDSEWLCKLLRNGLLRGSFIPPYNFQHDASRHPVTRDLALSRNKCFYVFYYCSRKK